MPVNRLTLKNWHRSGWNVADIYAAPADNCLAHVASPVEVVAPLAVSSDVYNTAGHGVAHTRTYKASQIRVGVRELEL